MNISLRNTFARPSTGECLALHFLAQLPAPIAPLVAEKLADMRLEETIAFEASTARVRNAACQATRSHDIAVARSIITRHGVLQGVGRTAPLEAHLDEAMGITRRHQHAKQRFDQLRQQGHAPSAIIATLAEEMRISRAAVQLLLLSRAKVKALHAPAAMAGHD